MTLTELYDDINSLLSKHPEGFTYLRNISTMTADRNSAQFLSACPQQGKRTCWTFSVQTNETHTEPSPIPILASPTIFPLCWFLLSVLCSSVACQPIGQLLFGLRMLFFYCTTALSVQTSGLFREAAVREEHVALYNYTYTAVLSYIQKSVEDVTCTRTTYFLNQKLWLNVNIRSLLNARDAVFHSGNRQAVSV